jgi:uncharacterized protein (UPF0333 family)
MKAQVSFEYLIMIALILAAVTITYVYVNQQQQLGTSSTQAQVAADSIRNAADNLYAQGPGAKTQIRIVFPDAYISSKSSLGGTAGNLILIKIALPSQGETDVIAITRGNISGSLPETSGTKYLSLELLTTGVVNVISS